MLQVCCCTGGAGASVLGMDHTKACCILLNCGITVDSSCTSQSLSLCLSNTMGCRLLHAGLEEAWGAGRPRVPGA